MKMKELGPKVERGSWFVICKLWSTRPLQSLFSEGRLVLLDHCTTTAIEMTIYRSPYSRHSTRLLGMRSWCWKAIQAGQPTRKICSARGLVPLRCQWTLITDNDLDTCKKEEATSDQEAIPKKEEGEEEEEEEEETHRETAKEALAVCSKSECTR